MAVFQQIVNVTAYSLSILTFMSPIPSLFSSWRRRDLGEISLVPFAAMVTNSFIWISYSWLSDDIFPLLMTFACGEVLGICYIIVFILLTPDKARSLKILSFAVAIIVLVALYIGIARSVGQPRDSIATVTGILSNIGSFIMYSSPFETIVRVIKTKDASSMPIHLCLVGAIGNSVWVIYAALIMDIIVLVPNVVCSAVGWIQVIVYVIYRPGKTVARHTKQLTSPVVDMSVDVAVNSPSVAYTEAASPAKVVV